MTGNEGIYNNVYYTLIGNNIVNEVSLQRGDLVFTLERDRRSMYPIFDRAKVVKVGESKPRASYISWR